MHLFFSPVGLFKREKEIEIIEKRMIDEGKLPPEGYNDDEECSLDIDRDKLSEYDIAKE